MSRSTKPGLSDKMIDSLVQEFIIVHEELNDLTQEVDNRVMVIMDRLDRLEEAMTTGVYPQEPEGGLESL